MAIVLDTPKTKDEYSWIRYIRQRIRQNKNFLAITTGQTGSGKTWATISIAEMLDPEFSVERIVFTGQDLMKLINSNKLKKGSVIVWDEAGIDMSNRNWQSTTNKMLNFLLQTFRHRNFILLFTTPYCSFVDKATRRLFHAEFRTESINFNENKTRLRAKAWQYNDKLDRVYEKYLRRRTDKGVVKITTWDVPAPSKEIIKPYEKKKTAFTTELNAEILRELKVVEKKKNGKKPLTELQQKIVDCWKEGITLQKEIAEKLGKVRSQITINIKYLNNKGYSIDDYVGIGSIAT